MTTAHHLNIKLSNPWPEPGMRNALIPKQSEETGEDWGRGESGLSKRRICYGHLVDKSCREVDSPSAEAAPLNNAFHLHDDQASTAVCGYCLHQNPPPKTAWLPICMQSGGRDQLILLPDRCPEGMMNSCARGKLE